MSAAPGDYSAQLAAYAAGLRLDDVPPHVVDRARECIIDTIAIGRRGRTTPWGQIAIAHASEAGIGLSRMISANDVLLAPEQAAFVNGLLSHALELDSLRKPGAGVHPGAIVVAAALAAAQDRQASGRVFMEGVIAGFEVLMRIGAATQHSAEPRGFHAPGLTGPFGAAAAAGRIFGFDAVTMNSAFGIAGSMSAGLMQFAVEGQGAMVKRLHIGRAAQNGLFAARLAERGFSGPHQILEGEKGFLATYCEKYRLETLTEGLGEAWETLNLCLKRYPCHITAHTPIYAVECWQAELDLKPEDVANITVHGTSRMAEMNGVKAPTDPAMANYSIPFSVACALTGAAADPASFDPAKLGARKVRELAAKIDVVSDGRKSHSDWMTRSVLTCTNGRVFEREVSDFPGTPSCPLSMDDLRARFTIMTGQNPDEDPERLFERLCSLEQASRIDWIH
ncbi:MAG: propionate catabolism protein [Hyphomicrobiales bacterium]|nr:propionate catabolism protein [Hyphomicrobiales bacterium]